MAGIYIHIPFCRQACHYCDFHFSTNQRRKGEMVEAIVKELHLQQHYLGNDPVNTIYLGGGTPSLLTEAELKLLLEAVDKNFNIGSSPEITLEANPDDLHPDKLHSIRQAGVNRLSIGIQSFHEPHLQYLNRAHNATEAMHCIKEAQHAGFDNISIDLIYGIPAKNHTIWEKDLQTALELHPQHISSYCLTIEEKTVFGKWLKKQKIKEADEDFAAEQFEILLAALTAHGYEQYEISNFCLPEFYSQHNSNYWKKEKYLGAGPGAHSYDGQSRQFNVSNNTLYLKAMAKGTLSFEKEVLQPHEQINEYIMTGLRSKWGCDLKKISEDFSYDLYGRNKNYIEDLLTRQQAIIQHNHLILTNKGKLLADGIAADLFLVS